MQKVRELMMRVNSPAPLAIDARLNPHFDQNLTHRSNYEDDGSQSTKLSASVDLYLVKNCSTSCPP
jgi:hypothetical protein